MDYLDIVLNGYFDTNNREHLSKYFFREFKKAEKEHYVADEFFSGCLKVIEAFEYDLDQQLFERKKELYLMLNAAKHGTINFAENRGLKYEQLCQETISECEEELKEISRNNFTVYLSSVTKGKIAHNMFYDEVLYIKKAILEASENNLPQTETEKLKVNQIALIYVYEGIHITRENASGIAAKYGYTAKNSGEGLFQDYTTYSSAANRKGKPTLCTPKKLKNKILLFESIIEYLTDNAKQRAFDEIGMLKTIYETEYQ